MKACKVVIPAAGMGTRFLPITKSIPKEMLPILEKPVVHYVAQEAMASDFDELVFIVNQNKSSIATYFGSFNEFKSSIGSDRTSLLSELEFIVNRLKFNYITQDMPLGLGHAVLQSKIVINDDYFGISLPDEIIISNIPVLKQLKDLAYKFNCSVVAVQEVPEFRTSSYGIIKIGHSLGPNIFDVSDFIEKPKSNPPSNYAIIGRYFLSRDIFDYLEDISADKSGEIQLTEALKRYVRQGNRVLAINISGLRFDVGNPVGWFQANEYYKNLTV